LFAISIFTMSILGLLSILASGISDTNYAKEKMVASYLAQEGIEYVRNMRDTAVLYDTLGAQHGWNAFKVASKDYPITDPILLVFYSYYFNGDNNSDEVKISSTVSWMQGSGNYCRH